MGSHDVLKYLGHVVAVQLRNKEVVIGTLGFYNMETGAVHLEEFEVVFEGEQHHAGRMMVIPEASYFSIKVK